MGQEGLETDEDFRLRIQDKEYYLFSTKFGQLHRHSGEDLDVLGYILGLCRKGSSEDFTLHVANLFANIYNEPEETE